MEDKIMKKTYINPTMDIVKIASQAQILAGSEQTMGSKGNFGNGEGVTLGGHSNDGDDW